MCPKYCRKTMRWEHTELAYSVIIYSSESRVIYIHQELVLSKFHLLSLVRILEGMCAEQWCPGQEDHPLPRKRDVFNLDLKSINIKIGQKKQLRVNIAGNELSRCCVSQRVTYVGVLNAGKKRNLFGHNESCDSIHQS